MIKPEVLDALVAAGCTAEQIAAAVKADQRRSSGAERQARYRERKKAEAASQSDERDVTSVTVTNPSPDKKGSPDPSKELTPSTPSEDKSSSGYTRDFEKFWTEWREAGGRGGKFEAFEVWGKLSAADRSNATECAAAYFAAWRKECPDASPLHGVRYLRRRRWEGMEDDAPTGDVFLAQSAWNFHPLRSRYLEERGGEPPPAVQGGQPGALFPAKWVQISNAAQRQANG